MKAVTKTFKKAGDELISKSKKQDTKGSLDLGIASEALKMMPVHKKQKMDYVPLKEFKKSKKKSM